MGSKISCVDVIKNENKDEDRESGIDCTFNIFSFLLNRIFPKTGSATYSDKGRTKTGEINGILRNKKDNLNNPDSYFDRIENGGIYGTPKIEIPKNIQGNLNKNRPNFAINSYDPLVFDLNGDGKINLINSQTYFDYEGDGIKEAGYWLDKFNNRKIA